MRKEADDWPSTLSFKSSTPHPRGRHPASISSRNFLVLKADGTMVVGALSINGLGTVVTFNPTSNLAAGADYLALVTTAVCDLAGNALAAPEVTNFSTAA